jgi:hypothetical protein
MKEWQFFWFAKSVASQFKSSEMLRQEVKSSAATDVLFHERERSLFTEFRNAPKQENFMSATARKFCPVVCLCYNSILQESGNSTTILLKNVLMA